MRNAKKKDLLKQLKILLIQQIYIAELLFPYIKLSNNSKTAELVIIDIFVVIAQQIINIDNFLFFFMLKYCNNAAACRMSYFTFSEKLCLNTI